jgi:hypothetical protein
MHMSLPPSFRKQVFALLCIWSQSDTPTVLAALSRELLYLLFDAMSEAAFEERPLFRIFPSLVETFGSAEIAPYTVCCCITLGVSHALCCTLCARLC